MGWIRTSDRLPDKDGRYLTVTHVNSSWVSITVFTMSVHEVGVPLAEGETDRPGFVDSRYDWGEYVCEEDVTENITHWMPLPELPND